MDVINRSAAAPFTTKDGSEIRELLAHRNSCIRKQSLAEARLPPAGRTTPHFHPVKERVAVISGKILLGFGDKFNKSGMREMDAGSYVSLTPNSSHYVLALEETVLQLASIGPWHLTYVNPADDPRLKK